LAEDLDHAGTAAHLAGEDLVSVELWTRAHHAYLRQGQVERAVHCAFWLRMALMFRGEMAQSSGWLSRGTRLLDEAGIDSVERGYLEFSEALQSYWSGGDMAASHASFLEAVRIGDRFHEPELILMARIGVGETLVNLGDAAGGMAILDEAMASVTSGEVSPLVVGLAYCAVLACCQLIFDLDRAREWTEAFARWCESQPDLVPYRGECQVFRAEVMQLHGAWPVAMEEARRAAAHLRHPGVDWAGGAYYQQAEIHRLRGEYREAEEAYRQASEWGGSPHPGLALLWLAQGRTAAAAGALSRALAEVKGGPDRCRLLAAHVEVMLAAGNPDAAGASANELTALAAEKNVPFIRALASQARGAVSLHGGDAGGALPLLRNAASAWLALEVPYEAARVRLLIAEACRRLGDHDTAALEIGAARRVFEQLGAIPDLARLAGETHRDGAGPFGLSDREREVLRLLSKGKSNREIAEDLVLSEHTVRRHLQNIFGKLDVSNRAGATAFAFEHDLV
jgi:DNA-binding CsgD family transcriptional regulator